MAKTTDEQLRELQDQIEALKKALGSEQEARTAAEQRAFTAAEASAFTMRTAEEQPTGKTIKTRVCSNPWVKDVKEQTWTEVDIPTFFYTIQLPAGAGLMLTTNGAEYYHGQTYTVDYHLLCDLKSRVARCWDHEKSIHGENENAYRKPNPVFVGAGAA